MNFKITITERGKTIKHRGTSVRTPTEIILNKQEAEFVILQLRQLGITQFVCEEYVPAKKIPVQREHSNEKIEPVVEELTEETPSTLLRQLASREN